MAAWQLFNFAELTARHRGKPLLRINLDETRIGLHFSGPRGLQARAVNRRAPKAKAGRRRTVVQNVPLGKKRAGFTHVAMICDDTSLQPRLPQILLGNEAIFPVATLDAVRPTLPPNVRLWRRNSGWVTKDLLRDIIRELAIALGELTATHTVVLLLDTASMHICPRAIGMAARHGICMQYIPAKMTWLLQPLDTHVFARYKLHLVQQYRNHLLQSTGGQCGLPAVIQAVVSAIRRVLQGVAWDYAFDGNGFSANRQSHVRDTILEELDWPQVPELPARLPDYPDLSSVFPGGRPSHLRQCSGPTETERPSLQPAWWQQLHSRLHSMSRHCHILGLDDYAAPATCWRRHRQLQTSRLRCRLRPRPLPTGQGRNRRQRQYTAPAVPPHLRLPVGRRLPVLRPLARRADPANAAASA